MMCKIRGPCRNRVSFDKNDVGLVLYKRQVPCDQLDLRQVSGVDGRGKQLTAEARVEDGSWRLRVGETAASPARIRELGVSMGQATARCLLHDRRTDARNWPITYTLDALNRVTGQLHCDATRDTFTFDADGRLITRQDVTGVHDQRLRRARSADRHGTPDRKQLTWIYDAVGRQSEVKDPDGYRQICTYDAQGRLTGMNNLGYSELTTFQYDALSRETVQTFANGMGANHGYGAAVRETVLAELTAYGTVSLSTPPLTPQLL